MLKDERGFTLIELIISMTVFVIVAGTVIIFMITGTNSFNRTKHELDLQLQTQTVINQLQDMIKSANYVEYKTTAKDGKNINSLSIYQVAEKTEPIPTPNGISETTKPLVAGVDPSRKVNKIVQKKRVVYWVDSGKSMYLEEYNSDIEPVYSASDSNLFAEYVEDFKALVVKKAVKLDISMVNGASKYKISETASMRNRTIKPPDVD